MFDEIELGREVGAFQADRVNDHDLIGRGDFAGHVELPQNDELALLAGEMNAMCDRLVATLEQLRHSDRLTTVGKLASGVAHELGTPLNVVSARAGMMASGEVTGAEAAAYARIVVDASERMAKIIRQLLAFARRKRVADRSGFRGSSRTGGPIAVTHPPVCYKRPTRLSTVATNDWRLRGMATLPEARRKGCGAALVRACIAHAKAHGGARIWCHAREGARAFYEVLGFVVEGETFELERIGAHYVMWRVIA